MTISKIGLHFSIVTPRSRSQLHVAGAFITFSDCPVLLLLGRWHFMEFAQKFIKTFKDLSQAVCQISESSLQWFVRFRLTRFFYCYSGRVEKGA